LHKFTSLPRTLFAGENLMSGRTLEERIINLAFSPHTLSTSLDSSPTPKPTSPKAALRRCCAAWQRSFDEFMASGKGAKESRKTWAAIQAREAYRNAMPLLAGYEGVRDFIACTAHGILIGAIEEDISGKLLYAAQVALNTLPYEPKQFRQPKQPKHQSSEVSPLPPIQKALSAGSDSTPTQMQ
jgi:hypothetical protein